MGGDTAARHAVPSEGSAYLRQRPPALTVHLRIPVARERAVSFGAGRRISSAGYCTLRRIRLLRVMADDAVSGARPLAQRPGGGELASALRKREATHVIMLKLDRGFRNAADCLATVEKWQQWGVTLHIIDLGGNAIDTASAAGKFMLTVLAGAAEMERNITSERTRAALQVKRMRGQRISRWASFGNRIMADGSIEPDDRERGVITLVHELKSRGLSLRLIATELVTRQLTGRNGQPISPKTIRTILRRSPESSVR